MVHVFLAHVCVYVWFGYCPQFFLLVSYTLFVLFQLCFTPISLLSLSLTGISRCLRVVFATAIHFLLLSYLPPSLSPAVIFDKRLSFGSVSYLLSSHQFFHLLFSGSEARQFKRGYGEGNVRIDRNHYVTFIGIIVGTFLAFCIPWQLS